MAKPNKPDDPVNAGEASGEALGYLLRCLTMHQDAAKRLETAAKDLRQAQGDYDTALVARNQTFDAVVLAFNRFHSADSDWLASLKAEHLPGGGDLNGGR